MGYIDNTVTIRTSQIKEGDESLKGRDFGGQSVQVIVDSDNAKVDLSGIKARDVQVVQDSQKPTDSHAHLAKLDLTGATIGCHVNLGIAHGTLSLGELNLDNVTVRHGGVCAPSDKVRIHKAKAKGISTKCKAPLRLRFDNVKTRNKAS